MKVEIHFLQNEKKDFIIAIIQNAQNRECCQKSTNRRIEAVWNSVESYPHEKMPKNRKK